METLFAVTDLVIGAPYVCYSRRAKPPYSPFFSVQEVRVLPGNVPSRQVHATHRAQPRLLRPHDRAPRHHAQRADALHVPHAARSQRQVLLRSVGGWAGWAVVSVHGVQRLTLNNVSFGQCLFWSNISLGQCLFWSMSLLVNVSFGQCLFWSMSLLVNVSFGQCLFWSMSFLVNVSLVGECLSWSMSLLGNVSLAQCVSLGQCLSWSMFLLISFSCGQSLFWSVSLPVSVSLAVSVSLTVRLFHGQCFLCSLSRGRPLSCAALMVSDSST